MRLHGSGKAGLCSFPLSLGWAPALEELLATCQYCGCSEEWRILINIGIQTQVCARPKYFHSWPFWEFFS